MKILKQIGILAAIIAVAFGMAYFVVKTWLNGEAPVAEKADKLSYKIPVQVVNLSGTNGTRYLKIELVLEYELIGGTKHAISPETYKTMLIDTLIMHLSSKTIAAVDGFENKEILKEELRQKFQKVLSPEQRELTLTAIFLQSFLIQ